MTQSEIENLFNYHAPSPEMTSKFVHVREAIVKAALVY